MAEATPLTQSVSGGNWKKTLLTVLRFGIGIALVWYLMSSGGLEWGALTGLLERWWLSVLALVLMVLGLWFNSWRFCVLLRPRGLAITLPASMRLTLIGMFFNTCLPGSGGGEVVRMYYGARGHEGRRAEILTVMGLDRVTGMFGLILWPLLVAPLFWPLWSGEIILVTLLAGGLVTIIGMMVAFAVSWSPLVMEGGPIPRLLERLPGGTLIQKIVNTVASFRNHRGAVLKAIGISLVSHTTAMSAALAIAAAVNPAGFSWAMSVLIPLGFMANTIPLTPGGLGVGEAAFDSLFGLMGLSGGAELLLGWRFFILAIGLVGLMFYLWGRREFVKAPARDPANSAVQM